MMLPNDMILPNDIKINSGFLGGFFFLAEAHVINYISSMLNILYGAQPRSNATEMILDFDVSVYDLDRWSHTISVVLFVRFSI